VDTVVLRCTANGGYCSFKTHDKWARPGNSNIAIWIRGAGKVTEHYSRWFLYLKNFPYQFAAPPPKFKVTVACGGKQISVCVGRTADITALLLPGYWVVSPHTSSDSLSKLVVFIKLNGTHMNSWTVFIWTVEQYSYAMLLLSMCHGKLCKKHLTSSVPHNQDMHRIVKIILKIRFNSAQIFNTANFSPRLDRCRITEYSGLSDGTYTNLSSYR
jgi:hypothetical protein